MFEADFKQQQSEMTNKIDTMLKAITDRIAGTLPSDMVKNPKLSTYPVLSARSYPTEDPEKENKEEEDNPENIHINPPTPPNPSVTFITKKVLKFNSFFESLRLVLPSSNTELIYTKEENGDVMFIEIVRKDDNSHKEETEAEEQKVEYFDIFPTRSELAYHNSIMDPRLSQVVLGKPFVEISNMTHDPPKGVVRFTNGNNEISYKMPRMIEQYDSLSNLKKEHTRSVYLMNEEDKRRGLEYVMSKILGFYRECLELRPEYLTVIDDEGEVTGYENFGSFFLDVIKSLSLEYEHVAMNLTLLKRGFPAKSVRYSNADALDSLLGLCLIFQKSAKNQTISTQEWKSEEKPDQKADLS
nr:protein kinase-like domain, concanavalin A-like lectin/glucanase domain protein [Tanacetum cinerariifolium]